MATEDTPAQGYVSISYEVFDYKGVRINILKESFPVSEFLDKVSSTDICAVTQRLNTATSKEILSPSVKKDMV